MKTKKFRDSMLGNKNPAWKGNNAGMNAKHKYLNTHYPRKKICTICHNKTKTFYCFKEYHKSNGFENYTRDINDYIEMCQSCHDKHDYKIGVRTPYKRNKELNKKMSITITGTTKSSECKKKLSIIKTKFHFTRNYLINQYWISEHNMKNRIIDKKQKSAKEIANIEECSETTIRNAMKNFNILRRTQSEAKILRDKKNNN